MIRDQKNSSRQRTTCKNVLAQSTESLLIAKDESAWGSGEVARLAAGDHMLPLPC